MIQNYYEYENVFSGNTDKQKALIEKENLRWESFKKSKDYKKIKKLRKKVIKYNKKIKNLRRKNNYYL